MSVLPSKKYSAKISKHTNRASGHLRPGGLTDISTEDYMVRQRVDFILKTKIEGCKILDGGCGIGIYAEVLSSYVSQIVGIDINKNYLNRAASKRRGNVELALMSAEKLGFKEGVFDIVIMIEVLEHIPDDKKALEEVYRVLKPGGKLIISVPNKFFPFETHAIRMGSKVIGFPVGIPLFSWFPLRLRNRFETARVYTAKGLRKTLTEQGFSILKIEYFMPSLDGVERRFLSKNSKPLYLVRKILEFFEKSKLTKKFGSSIVIIAEKKN